jgi:tRNA pseudouridine55 synthase
MAGARSEGLLLVDKPAGMTSHDAVNRARRALGERRIGHAGTLDPFATGLLVLLVGRATRVLPYVDGEPKVYEATIRFGTETDTDDLTGSETARAAMPSRERVDNAIAQLTGGFEQVPPAYSAKQVDGRRAYSAARRGETMVLAPNAVHVHDWKLVEWRGDEMDVVVTCAGGTYVRALARDLGRLAASAAHLSALRRASSGPLRVAEATPAMAPEVARLRPALDAMPSMARVTLDTDGVERIKRGMPVPVGASSTDAPRCALLDRGGALVAIAERNGELWQPKVVLREA